jgi:PAS domain S-box-containing protein
VEEAVRQAQVNRLRYLELFEFVLDAYLITDGWGVIEHANEPAAALLQTRKAFLIGKPLFFFVAERSRRDFYGVLRRVAKPAAACQSEELNLRSVRGDSLEVSVAVAPIFEATRPGGLCWRLHDLTPRRRVERALHAEKLLADSLREQAQAVILVLDSYGRILSCNPYARTLTGWSDSQLLGTDWTALLWDSDEVRGRTLLLEALRAGKAEGRAHRLRGSDGQLRVIVWSAKVLGAASPDDGAAILVLGQDITELVEAQQKALQVERLAAIGEMVAGLAHESRNALQRSRACLERLRWRLQDQPGALGLLERALRAQQDLVNLFEDVRGYAAPIKVHAGPCLLPEIWREAWAQAHAVFAGKHAQLQEDTAGVDLCCAVDRHRLTQVFRNILENAFAAAPDPVRVTITCREDVPGGRPALRIAVRDNGPGLDAEQQQRIFEPFYSTKVKGTGLGMAIVRRIVEAHGGTISAASEPGGGAEIVLVLPRAQP